MLFLENHSTVLLPHSEGRNHFDRNALHYICEYMKSKKRITYEYRIYFALGMFFKFSLCIIVF